MHCIANAALGRGYANIPAAGAPPAAGAAAKPAGAATPTANTHTAVEGVTIDELTEKRLRPDLPTTIYGESANRYAC